jgi:fatty-acyl-CoA synthase
VGVLALGGRNPVGYYKDEQKSAATFREIDGVRYSIPGDFATVDADGSIQLLGRGSVVINTGGEKVFPEEVEEALKTHPAVRDAVAVGIPDKRFGEVVAAVVEPATSPPPTGRLQSTETGALRREHRTLPRRQDRLRAPPVGNSRVGGERVRSRL